MSKANDYDVHSIEAHEGLSGVRVRPSMYLGENDKRGVVHLFKEIFGNSTDEATNGFGKHIQVAFHMDGSVTVADQGRGIPVGPFPKDKTRDTLTVIMTVLHSGGKFAKGKDNYSKGRVGLHGLGLGVVNALTDSMKVWSFRNKVWNYQGFVRGKPVKPKPAPAKLPVLPFKQPNQGTVVQFKPDLTCFTKNAYFDQKLALEWLDDVSYLIGDVKVDVHVEGKKGWQKPIVMHRPNGLLERFDMELKRLKATAVADPLVYHSDTTDLMLGWTSHTEEVVYSAVGAIRTVEGGTHVRGLEAAITNTFRELAKKGDDFKPEFLRAGMVAVINVRLDEPKFNSQDKVKLVSEDARQAVIDELYTNLPAPLFEYVRKSKALRDVVLERAREFTNLQAGFQASKRLKAAFKTESKGKVLLPLKHKAATTDDAEERELFIVEGDSAAGTAGNARDSTFQEVQPLTGKITNAFKAKDLESVLLNPRVADMMIAIGYDPSNPGTFRVGKVIATMDADEDGHHIALLLFGLFHLTMPQLIQQGRLFYVNAPLYSYRSDYGSLFGNTKADVFKELKRINPRAKEDPTRMVRLKGLGEMNAPDLEKAAFSKATRDLRLVTPVVSKQQAVRVMAMLGDDAEPRRRLLGL